ncbi:MAG: glycosyltransferase family 4 protein [Candidatus Lokiarchaeota archaeon]|nr:glycosyltransferase family 4 protein [Candidatus Lokiarchaeota archaeon]
MKFKILHFISELSQSSGITNYIINLIKGSDFKNYSISILTFNNTNDERLIKWLENVGIEVIVLKKRLYEKVYNKYLRFILKNIFVCYYLKYLDLKRYLQNYNYDRIIAHGEEAELLMGLVGLRIKNRINVIHSDSYFPKNIFYRLILNLFSRKGFDKTICINRKNYLKFSRIYKNAVKLIYAGIEIENYKYKKRSNDIITIGFIGRIDRKKGIFILLKAFNILSQRYPNLDLMIAGTGKDVGKFMKLVEKLKNSKIKYLREIENKSEFYQNIDVLVLPSYTEGIPITIIEAMAFNILVIANDVGGISEIVTNEETGILIKNNHVKTIVDAIERVVKRKYNTKQIIENAYRKLSEFSIDRFAKQFYDFIK